jgi:hypothetical protein
VAADKLTKIQKDLDETKVILHQTIDSVLRRGEKLDTLVDKSADLSLASQMFYKQVRALGGRACVRARAHNGGADACFSSSAGGAGARASICATAADLRLLLPALLLLPLLQARKTNSCCRMS